MKTLARIVLFLSLCMGAAAQQSVTVLNNGSGTGTFNTPGVTYYLAGPAGGTWDFTNVTVKGVSGGGGGGSYTAGSGLKLSGTVFSQDFTYGGAYTGANTYTSNGSYIPARFYGYNGEPTLFFQSNGSAGTAYGLEAQAGANASDYAFYFLDISSNPMLRLDGAGQLHAAKFYSAAGLLATDASGNITPNQNYIDVEAYGAKGDGLTDDTAAILAASTALQAAGGGHLVFGAYKTYLMTSIGYSSSETDGKLGVFSGVPVSLDFNGCLLKITTTTYTGSQASYLFSFTNCVGVHIGNVSITSPAQAIQSTYTAGIRSFNFYQSCADVVGDAINQYGGISCVYIRRDANVQAVANRTQGSVFQLISCQLVGYPLALSHSGDNTTANLVCNSCYRDAIIYGCKGVFIHDHSINHYGQLLIQSYDQTAGSPAWNDDPYTQDVWVDYTCEQATLSRAAGGGPAEGIVLAAQGPNPCYLSDIYIHFSVNNSSTYPEDTIVSTYKESNGSADGTASRGHVWNNINISGVSYNAPGNYELVLFDPAYAAGILGNWQGETINNLNVHDLTVLGSTGSTFDVYDSCLYGDVFSNVNFAGALAASGTPGSIESYWNCVFDGTFVNGQTGPSLPAWVINGFDSTALGVLDLGSNTGLPAIISGTGLRLAQANGTKTAVEMDSFASNNTVFGRASQGTRASPAATTTANQIIGFNAYGYDGAAWASGGQYYIEAGSTWSNTNHELEHVWTGTINGSTTPGVWMTLTGAGLAVANGIQNTAIGSTTPSSGAFTTVSASGAVAVNNGITASGSTSNDFSGGSGTFKTSTGAFTVSSIGAAGAVVSSASGVLTSQVNYYAGYQSGTAYTLTNGYAAVVGGTTSASITLAGAGTYLITGSVVTEYAGATFAANQTESFEFYRTNNSGGALTSSTVTNELRILTTLTDSAGAIPMPAVLYTTANSNDIVTIYGEVSTTPSAGALNVTGANIMAIRLY